MPDRQRSACRCLCAPGSVYAYFLGDLESYATTNEHFYANGDAIRCAMALSDALMGAAVQLYDPDAWRRQQWIDLELRRRGIQPRPAPPTQSDTLVFAVLRLSRLARVLPAAAAGNYQPLYESFNQLEQADIVAGQLFKLLPQLEPNFDVAMAQVKPLILEAASLEYTAILEAANSLADMR